MVSRDEELWAATRTLAMHERDGRCAHCTRDGCRMRTWALAIRKVAADEGRTVPPLGPVWTPGAPVGIYPARGRPDRPPTAGR